MSVAPALILHPDVDLQVSPQEHPPATDDVSLSVPTSHDDDIMVKLINNHVYVTINTMIFVS